MPLYEYECEACGQRFELIRKFSDPAVEVCARCGRGPVHRQPSTPAIQFKGSGWYITDYARKGTGSGSEKSGGDKPAGEKSGGDKPTGEKSGESKTDSSTKADASAKSDGAAKDSGGTKP